jgi:hypothetical protein
MVIEAIRAWVLTFGEPPAISDWGGGGHARTPERITRYRRLHAGFRRNAAAGRIPSAKTVTDKFGSWNAAIEAAGFTPRSSSGASRPLRTHCIRGHEYTPENTRLDKRGARKCRRCQRIHHENFTARRKAKKMGVILAA